MNFRLQLSVLEQGLRSDGKMLVLITLDSAAHLKWIFLLSREVANPLGSSSLVLVLERSYVWPEKGWYCMSCIYKAHLRVGFHLGARVESPKIKAFSISLAGRSFSQA